MSSLVLRLMARPFYSKCLPVKAIERKALYLTSCNRHTLHRPLHISSQLTQIQQEKDDSTKDIDVQRERPYEHLSFGQKVARAGTDLTYVLVVIAGIGITGILFYAVGSELFSSSGPNAVYSAAFKKCINDVQVLDALGQPVKGHGETNRRGRRQHVQHTEFINKDGEQHTRIKFYLTGAFRSAVVHAEMFKNSEGKQEFEYLVVELEGYPPKSIELERRKAAQPTYSSW